MEEPCFDVHRLAAGPAPAVARTPSSRVPAWMIGAAAAAPIGAYENTPYLGRMIFSSSFRVFT